jgi:predicted ATPase
MLPDAYFTFKHALVQDAAYESLLRSKRQELHRRIVGALEAELPGLGETEPEILAHHCQNGGLIGKAIVNWLRAGQQAIARSALVEAIAQIQKGLSLLPQLLEGEERDRQELALQLALGGALIPVSGYAAETTGGAYARAHCLGQQLGDTPSLVRALWGQFVHHHVRGEMGLSHRAATELLELGERENDSVGCLTGHRAVGDGLLHIGQLAAARMHLEKCVTLSNPMDHRSLTYLLAENVRVASLSFLSLTLALMGFADQAIARTEQALNEARALSHSTSLAFALATACRVHSALGDIRMVRRLNQELRDLASKQHFAFFGSTARIYHGLILLDEGEFVIGTELLQSGIASFKRTGATWILPLFMGWLATAYEQVGQLDEGLRQLDIALELSKAMGVRCYEGELNILKGKLLLARGPCSHIEAEASFREAIALARQQGAKLFELRASISLARLWMCQGEWARAQELLMPIYAWFSEGLDTLYLQEARELISQLVQSEET